jgi:hypothetical protein
MLGELVRNSPPSGRKKEILLFPEEGDTNSD